jgi:TRAP-type mannitol/chloroaromatic compound transport system permease small subunit
MSSGHALPERALAALDRLTGFVIAALQWLVLPLVILLFIQWPLHALFAGYALVANDLAQALFALYVAGSFTAATRAGTHLSADILARNYSVRARERLRRMGVAVALVPWALFALIAGRQTIVASVELLERFPETYNPGHFVIKLALWVMTLLILAQAMLDLFGAARRSER